MHVLVDTCVWSLLLRRRPAARLDAYEQLLTRELRELGDEGRICMLGVIRQELLTGIHSTGHFKQVRDRLAPFEDYKLTPAVHERSAENANYCRKRGVETYTVDILICTVAQVESMPVFSTDPDIARIAKLLSLRMHEPREFPAAST
jgi:predicted nucleic acid-binding protein